MPRAEDANLVLVGLRGSGKSTLGRELALSLQRAFVDLDDETARELGCATAGEAFRLRGEPVFRLAEVAALRRVVGGRAQVIALGGGTPTAPGAAELIVRERDAGTSWVVYLHASPDVLRRRLEATDTSTRPAVLGRDPLGEIGQVYAARDSVYRSLADVVVEVSDTTATGALQAILIAWRG